MEAGFALLLLFTFSLTVLSESALNTPSNPNNFIESSCRATRYPAICVKSLSAYATTIPQNEQHLAQAALIVSLARVKSAASFVSKLTKSPGIKHREYLAIKDCMETLSDAVDWLGHSIKEMDRVGQAAGENLMWHVSNVQTWVSAALTDEDTCLDGFAGRAMDGNIKRVVRIRVVSVAQVTSNALALVNRFADRINAKFNNP